MQHYRTHKFYVPETKGISTGQTARFFPSYCTAPTMQPAEAAIMAAKDLIDALKNQNNNNNNLKLTKSHHTALRDISNIFKEAATG